MIARELHVIRLALARAIRRDKTLTECQRLQRLNVLCKPVHAESIRRRVEHLHRKRVGMWTVAA